RRARARGRGVPAGGVRGASRARRARRDTAGARSARPGRAHRALRSATVPWIERRLYRQGAAQPRLGGVMPEADLGGVRIHYRFNGERGRPALVLSSSLGTSMGMWDPQVEALGHHFCVLRYDARGHGASSVPAGPYSIAQMGSDVLALMSHVGVAKAHFCGLSMGGMVGLWLGIHAPAHFERIVVSNTAARIGPVDGWNARIAKVR